LTAFPAGLYRFRPHPKTAVADEAAWTGAAAPLSSREPEVNFFKTNVDAARAFQRGGGRRVVRRGLPKAAREQAGAR
jgi:hypothetical protein